MHNSSLCILSHAAQSSSALIAQVTSTLVQPTALQSTCKLTKQLSIMVLVNHTPKCKITECVEM